MLPRRIAEGVYSVGAVDWDRRLFDELIPLPDGTSYNAYLVRGESKTALIDTVDPKKTRVLLRNLELLGVERIDYVVANHAEQDHSGSLPDVLKRFPGASVVTNAKCRDIISRLLPIPQDRFVEVGDGDEIDLGGKTLRFIIALWVHWPETMLTYIVEDGILFTCDLFGSHLATSELFAKSAPKLLFAAKRYYAEIMMPFRTTVRRHVERVKSLSPKIVAPSHGPVYSDPSFILDAYLDWTSDAVKNEVVIPYVSMHGSVEALVDRLVDSLASRGVVVLPFRLAATDLGELAMSLVDAATVVVATPTVLAGPHPQALYAAAIIAALKPKTKLISVVTSYGWGGKCVEVLRSTLGSLRAEFLDPVVVRGYPSEEDLAAVDALAQKIAEKHKEVIDI